MAQPNEILLYGLRFYRLDDGSLFPVLTGGIGGDDAPPPAEPSAEEKRLLEIQATSAEEQLKLARKQQAENNALMPLLLQQYGITRSVSSADPRVATLQAERAQLVAQDAARPQGAGPLAGGQQWNPRGYWESVSTSLPKTLAPNPRIAAIDAQLATMDKGGKVSYATTPDELMTKRKEIEGMQLDRSLKALKGELPVTATLAKELELGKRTLAEKLNRQLGPGWETSSAGIQANAEYDRMATSLKEAEQRDQLTTAEALSINRQGSRAANTEGLYSTISAPTAGASSLLRTAGGGAGEALNYYGTLRDASLQAKQMAGQETAGYVSGGMSLAGSATVAAVLI